MGAIDPNTGYGMDMSASGFGTQHGIPGAIKKNLRDNGATSLATIVLAPVAAKMLKRVARKPIADMNKYVFKPIGVGVKL